MNGTIRAKDVLLHPLVIVRGWGPRCYLRCLRAAVTRRRCTFLELVSRGA